jgi:hypothetical protein
MTRRLASVFVLLALAWATVPSPGAGAQDTPVSLIKVAEVSALLKQGSPVHIVDVRSRQEFLARHLPGALSVPLDTIEARASEIPRRGLVVLY